MTSTKPYLIRALYEWIADNDMTPYIIIDAETNKMAIPKKYIVDGQIVLNISALATHNLRVGNDAIEGDAAFGNTSLHLYIPMAAVLAIYAEESKQGLNFSPEEVPLPMPPEYLPEMESPIEIPESARDKVIPFRPRPKKKQ